MRRQVAALAVLATFVFACESKSPTGPEPPSAPVTALTVTGAAAFTALGQVNRMTATAELENAPSRDVTTEATWQSSDASVVTVSPRGEVRAVGLGTATVAASYQGKQGALDVNVVPADTPSLLAGSYRLTFTAAAACATLPDWARHREYDATIQQSPSLRLVVALGADRPEFIISLRGASLEIAFGTALSYGSYGQVYPRFWDVLDDHTVFAVEGTANGVLHNTRIAGVLFGDLRAVTFGSNSQATIGCNREDNQFTLVRR